MPFSIQLLCGGIVFNMEKYLILNGMADNGIAHSFLNYHNELIIIFDSEDYTNKFCKNLADLDIKYDRVNLDTIILHIR